MRNKLVVPGRPGSPERHIPRVGFRGLTPRMLEVLNLLAEGCDDHEIARRIDRSYRTATLHVAALRSYFDVHCRGQVVAKAYHEGYLLPKNEQPLESFDIRRMMAEIGEWHHSAFGMVGRKRVARKLLEEAAELMVGQNMEEVADVLIVLLAWCYHYGSDPTPWVWTKLEKLKDRDQCARDRDL